MGKALLFLTQITVFVTAAVWAVQRPGDVVINWGGYVFTVQLGYLLIASLVVVIIAMLVYRLVLAVMSIPQKAAGFRRKRLHDKGSRALLQGFSAVATGNGREAVRLAFRARGSLGGDDGLLLLLEAQAYRLNGDTQACEAALKALMDHRDLAYLGVRGMIRLSVENGNVEKALDLARQAMASHPGNPEMLLLAYQLQLRGRDWEQAGKILTLAVRKRAVSKEQEKSDRAALAFAEAERTLLEGPEAIGEAITKLKQAHRKHPGFVPVAVRLACLMIENGKKRRAIKIIEQAWKISPHPELARVWEELSPESRAKDPAARLRRAEKLIGINENSPESYVVAARAAMSERLWGEARTFLDRAISLQPGAKVFRLRAELEEKATGSADAALEWLEKAESAPPDKVWMCNTTGRIYDKWSPVAEPHGSFNTIIWSYPQEAGITCLRGQGDIWSSDLLQLG